MSTVALKRRALIRYGLGQPPLLSDAGVPIVRATNIYRGTIVPKDLIYTKVKDLPLDRAPLLEPGEVLVVRSGAYTGDSALVTERWRGAAPGYDLRLTPSNDLEPRFLAYSLLSRWGLDQIDLAKSRAAQPHLNAEDLGELRLMDLPLPRQREIADYLDSEIARIDLLVRCRTKLSRLIEERSKSLVAAHLTAASGPRVHLSHAARVFSGAGFPHAYQGRTEGAYPFFKVGDLARSPDGRWIEESPNRVDAQTARALGCRLAAPGSVLFPKVGAALLGNQRRITRVAAAFDNNLMAVTSDALEPRYLRYVLAQVDLGEMANPGPVPSINEGVVGSLPIVMAAWDEQVRIADQIDDALDRDMRLAMLNTRQTHLLRERRQALITAAVTGELAVPGVAAA